MSTNLQPNSPQQAPAQDAAVAPAQQGAAPAQHTTHQHLADPSARAGAAGAAPSPYLIQHPLLAAPVSATPQGATPAGPPPEAEPPEPSPFKGFQRKMTEQMLKRLPGKAYQKVGSYLYGNFSNPGELNPYMPLGTDGAQASPGGVDRLVRPLEDLIGGRQKHPVLSGLMRRGMHFLAAPLVAGKPQNPVAHLGRATHPFMNRMATNQQFLQATTRPTSPLGPLLGRILGSLAGGNAGDNITDTVGRAEDAWRNAQ